MQNSWKFKICFEKDILLHKANLQTLDLFKKKKKIDVRVARY